MGVLIIIGQMILSLSLLIVLHEMGHFLPAKWFGTKVSKFYLFFDPWFELFSVKKGETRYGIGWLPLGGYVKIEGMVDESFDTDKLAEEPKPWEFRSKPAWQRLIIMLGGVTVNFVLGFLIYAMVMFVWGETYLPTQNATYGIAVDSLGQTLGLVDGDKVLGTENRDFDRLSSGLVRQEVLINGARTLRVERGGSILELPINDDQSRSLIREENKQFRLYVPRFPMVIKDLSKGPAKEAGLEIEDKVVALNGTPTSYYQDFTRAMKGLKNEDITLTVERNGQRQDFAMKTTEAGTIGVEVYTAEKYFDLERIEYSFTESIPAGIDRGWDMLSSQVKAYGRMFSNQLPIGDSLGSVISIGKLFGTTWDWERFWNLTGMLSLILAFLNLVPIPGLDGGHVMFLLYEVISGRKPSDKFVERATLVGFVLLVALMVLALGNDIRKLF